MIIITVLDSFIHFGYFYSASSSPPGLKIALDYSINTVSKLKRQSATGNCEWRTCPAMHNSFRCGQSGVLPCDLPNGKHI